MLAWSTLMSPIISLSSASLSKCSSVPLTTPSALWLNGTWFLPRAPWAPYRKAIYRSHNILRIDQLEHLHGPQPGAHDLIPVIIYRSINRAYNVPTYPWVQLSYLRCCSLMKA